MTMNFWHNNRMSKGQLLYYIVTKFDALIPEIDERFAYPKYGMMYGKAAATNKELENCISGFSPQLLGVLEKRLTLPLPMSDELRSSINRLIAKINAVDRAVLDAVSVAMPVKNANDYVSYIFQFLSSFLGTVDTDCVPLTRLFAFVKDEAKTKTSGFYGTQQLYAACYNYLYNTPTAAEIAKVISEISEEKTAALLASLPTPPSGPPVSGTMTRGGYRLSKRKIGVRKTKRNNKGKRRAQRKSRNHH